MDKKYFPSFYRTHVKRVYRFLYFRVGARREVAEDLTHDVFLKAFNAFESYDPTVSKVSWIYMIARNHLINEMAKRKEQVDLADVEGVLADPTDMIERIASKHAEERILKVMGQLPPDEAKMIRMKYLEGWSFDDLAEIFEKTPGSLRVQTHRALKTLKGLLKQKPDTSV